MTNLEFIASLFPNVSPSQIWTGWNDKVGGQFPAGKPDKMPPAAGHYFCIGLLKPGTTRRVKGNIESILAFVLDDIGTKATAGKEIVATLGAPSWVMETSKGNFQWGWVYDRPVEKADWRRHRRAILECSRRWGTDKAGQDANRLVRLPSGVNVKPGKGLFRVALLATAKRRVELVDLMVALGLEWDGPGGEDDDELDLAELGQVLAGDFWVKVIDELGLALHMKPNGFLEIECPWAGNHSDAGVEGTAYLGDGKFRCQHDHCAGRKSVDFKEELRRRLLDAGRAGRGFMAIFDEERRARPVDEAEEAYLATKRAAEDKRREDEAMFAPPPGGWPEPLEGLTFADEAEALRRLIYVQSEKVFLDEMTGAVIDKTAFEEALWRDPLAVTDARGNVAIKRGQKSVVNSFLTRRDLRRVHHRVYRPGWPLFMNDEHLNNLPAMNVWRAPALTAEPPGQWLKVILHHIEQRLFVGDPDEAAIWLDWSSALVQRPREKCNWMPLVVGAGKTGKDLLFTLYGKLIGPENLYITGSKLMTDRATFADAIKHKLIMIEEVLDKSQSGNGRIDLDNVLKPLIAAPPYTIAVRGFRRGPEVTAKVANLVAFTNNMDALAIGTEVERRRYWIYESKAVGLTPDEQDELAEAVLKGAGEFLGFLLARDLKARKWSPFVTPVTAKNIAAADKMMRASMSGSAQRVLEIIEEGELAGRRFILSSELRQAAANARIMTKEQAHVIPDAMHKAGFTLWADGRKVRLPDGTQPRVWVPKTVPKDVHEWSPDKMRGAVEAEQKGRRARGLLDDEIAEVVSLKKD